MYCGCYFNDFQQEESGEKEYSSRENGSDFGYGDYWVKILKKKIQSNFILGKLLIVSIRQRGEVSFSCYQKEFGNLRSGASLVKNPPAKRGDTGLIPDLEDPACCRATKPMHHNYPTCALELGSCNY